MEKYNNLVSLLENLKEDAEKFFIKETMSAGSRLTKGLQTVVKASKELRKDVFEIKKAKKAEKSTTTT